MKKPELKSVIARGEDSRLQFKLDIRNPILISYVTKGLLPYHGLGSCIQRALNAWPQVEFTDDSDGCLFTATVHRMPVSEPKRVKTTPTTSGKTSGKILSALKQDGHLTIPALASMTPAPRPRSSPTSKRRAKSCRPSCRT